MSDFKHLDQVGGQTNEEMATGDEVQSWEEFLADRPASTTDAMMGRIPVEKTLLLTNLASIRSAAALDDASHTAWEQRERRFEGDGDAETRSRAAAKLQVIRLARAGKLALRDVQAIGVEDSGAVRIKTTTGRWKDVAGAAIDWGLRVARNETHQETAARVSAARADSVFNGTEQ